MTRFSIKLKRLMELQQNLKNKKTLAQQEFLLYIDKKQRLGIITVFKIYYCICIDKFGTL